MRLVPSTSVPSSHKSMSIHSRKCVFRSNPHPVNDGTSVLVLGRYTCSWWTGTCCIEWSIHIDTPCTCHNLLPEHARRLALHTIEFNVLAEIGCGRDSFANDALGILLLSQAENRRTDVFVVFAGYADKLATSLARRRRSDLILILFTNNLRKFPPCTKRLYTLNTFFFCS